ncbi:MAG: hypothetical protein A2289_26285 [Deltaproteobacteria bacterium RIFOXYA12_FULL_58_15]|nr:MAG: hypothetical protein A2289_26285 [Deltaproteobacteria bacterium RIFOXYA12_FULL_58_15]OGR09064.1 MAG: hypothetical protein A2341_25885 [Deltaproteobacteria bacterium RIFOXYB12_FULL_58_9]
MRRLLCIFVLAINAWSSNAHAQGLALNVDAGYARLLNIDNGNGVALNVYGGYEFASGIALELQVGFDYFFGERKLYEDYEVREAFSVLVVPLMPGVRFTPNLGVPVKPFLAAHVGPAFFEGTYRNEDAPPGDDSDVRVRTATVWGFNVGAGAQYLLTESMAVGFSAWWNMFLVVGELEAVKVINASLSFSARF